jgi:hypothetical protein
MVHAVCMRLSRQVGVRLWGVLTWAAVPPMSSATPRPPSSGWPWVSQMHDTLLCNLHAWTWKHEPS